MIRKKVKANDGQWWQGKGVLASPAPFSSIKCPFNIIDAFLFVIVRAYLTWDCYVILRAYLTWDCYDTMQKSRERSLL